MNTNFLAAQRRFLSAPLTLFIDLQMEYVAPGRAFYLGEMINCLSNCQRILEEVRKRKMPIAHSRQLRKSTFFNKHSEFSHWIEEFRPKPNEMVFERDLPSCYSSSLFNQFLQQISNPHLILVGVSGEQGCLATAIDASHKGHQASYIFDASASQQLGRWNNRESHDAVTEIIGLYADLCSTENFLKCTPTLPWMLQNTV